MPNLYKGKSTIVGGGLGVFTSKLILKSDLIVKYSGCIYNDRNSLSEFDRKRDFWHPQGCFLSHGLGGFFQHKVNPHARWEFQDEGKKICFYALCDILANEEIFIDYWDENGVRNLADNEIEIWENGEISIVTNTL